MTMENMTQAVRAATSDGGFPLALAKLVSAARAEERQRMRGTDAAFYQAGDRTDEARATITRLYVDALFAAEELQGEAKALRAEADLWRAVARRATAADGTQMGDMALGAFVRGMARAAVDKDAGNTEDATHG